MILKDDVTAAIRRAFQLGQTYWQQADSESYKENKKADATRDRYNALCIETAEIAARADTRIAELERECSQWRDELRIYRETEGAECESLRADALRYRWLRKGSVTGPYIVDYDGCAVCDDDADSEIDAAMGRKDGGE